MTNTPPTIDMRQYWDVLRSRKLAVIIPTFVAIALAALFVFIQKPQYAAQARVLVNPLLSPDPAGTTAKSNAPDMNTEQATAASAPVANLARATLKLSSGGDRLLSHLNVSASSTGNVLIFQYTSPDAQQAAQYANAFAQAYITYRDNSVLGPLNHAIADRKKAITLLQEQFVHAGSAQRTVLLAQLRDDEQQLATFESDVQLVSGGALIGSAVPPSSPSSPKMTTTILIAAVIGLVLGILLALIREGMDRRIKSADDLEAQLQAPVLGVIPRFKGRSLEQALVTMGDPHGAASEAYRATAVALENAAIQARIRTIMVVSPKEGGGASTAIANLGAVLAQAGHQVIMVSGNLRNPTLNLMFGIPAGRGLSTAVLEGKNVDRLLKSTPIPNLFLLNAGPEPEDPAALLSSPANAQVFADLQALKPDFILVDASPVLVASDAMILVRQVDGVVVTWNAEGFTAPSLRAARERLERAGAYIMGGIYAFDSGRPRGGASYAGSARSVRPAAGGPPQAAEPRDMRRAALDSSLADDSYDRMDSSLPRERPPAELTRSRGSGRVQP